VTEGPFKIIRHPEYFGEMSFLVLLTIALHPIFPFTLVTLGCDLLVIIGFNILVRKEERVNIAKWGDAYKLYMQQVPRFNIVKGLWRLRKSSWRK
jgi:protein-S-isoprenylcysteine O-methyltransferase Ste14